MQTTSEIRRLPPPSPEGTHRPPSAGTGTRPSSSLFTTHAPLLPLYPLPASLRTPEPSPPALHPSAARLDAAALALKSPARRHTPLYTTALRKSFFASITAHQMYQVLPTTRVVKNRIVDGGEQQSGRNSAPAPITDA